MPQRPVLRTVNTFVRGFITESSGLTHPEDASTEELNCSLLKDGSRRRRLGVALEDNFELSGESLTSDGEDVLYTDLWHNAGGNSSTTLVVMQVGDVVEFYESTSGTLSAQRKSFTIDLNDYVAPFATVPGEEQIDVTVIKGSLVIVSSKIEPILVEYDEASDSISVTEISLEERDFEWVGETSEYYEEDLTPSQERQYDTFNAGWGTEKGLNALDSYRTSRSGRWPPVTIPWYSGKNSDGNFSTTEWREIEFGNTLGVNGHYIYPLFEKNRTSVSGISGLGTYTIASRFTCTETYAGRVWYSGLTGRETSNIYFSQLVSNSLDNIGKLYQNNDPTAEDLSDLLDTDGGYLTIPEAYNIRKLHVLGPVLYVFAENGVWTVSGVDDVFRASEYSVSKITDFGLVYKESFVSARGKPYWWSNSAIHTLATNESGAIFEQNMTLSTIQSYFDGLDQNTVKGVYDRNNHRVFWSTASGTASTNTSRHSILIYDEPLEAFYPWEISEGDSYESVGLLFYSGLGSSEEDFTVIDSSNNFVVDSSINNVIVTRFTDSISSADIKVVIRDLSTGKITFGGFTDTSFLDWGSEDYSSYLITGDDFFDDISTKKNLPYLTCVMQTTETGYSNGSVIRPSGMLASAYWDFKSSSASGTQQAYRLKRPQYVETDEWDYPTTVIYTRLKVRGRGRSIKFKFESEVGKDFHILGWEFLGAKNDNL